MLKQRRNFNVETTSGFLRPFDFQIQSKFNVISSLWSDIVQRWVNVEMPAGIHVFVNPQIKLLKGLKFLSLWSVYIRFAFRNDLSISHDVYTEPQIR